MRTKTERILIPISTEEKLNWEEMSRQEKFRSVSEFIRTCCNNHISALQTEGELHAKLETAKAEASATKAVAQQKEAEATELRGRLAASISYRSRIKGVYEYELKRAVLEVKDAIKRGSEKIVAEGQVVALRSKFGIAPSVEELLGRAMEEEKTDMMFG